MAYNVKLIQYPNGSCQIRKYGMPIGAESNNSIEYDVEPFNGTKVRNVKEFGDAEENLKKSIARTRSKINEYARACSWEWFCTFTYDRTKIDRYDFKLCMSKLRKWLQNQKKYAENLKYLAVPEFHADGAIHAHVLLAEVGRIVFDKAECPGDIYNLSGWKLGFSTATPVKDTYRIQNYISKYITKELCLLSKHEHRYYASRNLPKPNVSVFLVEPAELSVFIMQLTDSIGVEFLYEKNVYNDYVDVTYMEYV